MTGHQPKPAECDSCGFQTDELVEVDAYARANGALVGPFSPPEEKEWGWICTLCFDTLAGNAFQYPRQYKNADVLRTVVYCANVILAAIKERA